MEPNFEKAINTIVNLAKQNPEFDNELRKRLQIVPSANVIYNGSSLNEDVAAIRSALEIRANPSITYGFVKEERLRDQLIVDNLRMENAALDFTEKDENHRFYVFCVNAFYQVENILNYFYHKSFPLIDDLLSNIELSTQIENDSFKFKRTGKEKDVSYIAVVHKINAFCNYYIDNGGSLKWIIGTLRQLRNEGEHRCGIIRKEKDKENNIFKFIQSNTFNDIRISLKRLVHNIEKELSNPSTSKIKKAQISSLLPSVCFVFFNGKNVMLPANLFSKVKHLKEGDDISVETKGCIIIDVIT